MAFKYVNAWIEVDEDEPTGTGYSNPSSCFQRLIDKNVYQSVDLLFICFILIVPTTTSGVTYVVDGFTLQFDPTPKHPGGLSDIDYVRMVKRDARKINPKIRFLAMLIPDIGRRPNNQISQIFDGATTPKEREARATNFAKNAVAFLKANDFHGFEIDWESPISDDTTQQQLEALARGLKGQFKDDYLFVMNTATTTSLTGDIINNNVAFLTLQLYSGMITEQEFLDLGIDKAKLAYGATFEAFPRRQQTPEEAYEGATAGDYTIVTQWRLNSGNFEQEQDGQVTLYALCKDLGLYIANYGPTALVKSVKAQGGGERKVPVGPKSFATVNARDVTGTLPWHIMNSPTITAATVISLPAIAAFDPNILTAVVYPYLTAVASPAG